MKERSALVITCFAVPLGTLFVLSYWQTLSWMYDRYTSPDSYYSHAFLVPFISGWLIYRERNQIRLPRKGFHAYGIPVLLFAVILHFMGSMLYIFALSGASLFVFLLGTVLLIFGATCFRQIIFSLAFLAFMFPVPLAVINEVAFPLKMLVAKVGTTLVAAAGIPVFLQGFYISIPNGVLLVGDPCSGLRSLIAFLAIGSLFAYLSNMRPWKKVVLFTSVIPIAVVSNILRLFILVLISHFYGVAAGAPDSFWHGASGVFVFVLGLILLFAIARLLEWKG